MAATANKPTISKGDAMFDIQKAVLVHWKQYYLFGNIIRSTNHGKAYLVRLANGLLVQVKAERIIQV